MKNRYLTMTVMMLLCFAVSTFAQVLPDTMYYEIVQTNPDIGATPPTPEAGFGSSSGGVLGMTNVQKYVRLDSAQGSGSILGKWLSAGDNVAPLLVIYFNIDSIYAEFKDDQTYVVRQVDKLGVSLVLEGTYSAIASGVGNIFKIIANQSSPTVLTSEGIFEIITPPPPDSMLYEIVQTNPDIGATPPTPEAGFGSSSGGVLGMTNVQKYIRLDSSHGSGSIVGRWLSAGENVAPLLVIYFNIDSIYAEFKDDQTYVVRQVDKLGVSLVLQGTYSAEPSGVGNIYKIVANQSSPTVLTSEGIFEISTSVTGVKTRDTKPNSFELHQNYPNPFNPTTRISFSLPHQSHIRLTVYNAIGQQVAKLIDENRQSGIHTIDFNASHLVNGVYFYRLEAGQFVSTRKMLLVK